MGLYIVFSVLILLCCLLLGIIVLVQNPKGGGLSQTFGGAGNQIMGARKTGDFLEKATWTLAICLCVFSVISAFAIPRGGKTQEGGQKPEVTIDETMVPMTAVPAATAAPATETPAQAPASNPQ